MPDNIVKYALAHYKDIKCAIKVQNGTENELELTNDWYGNSHLCVSSNHYYIFIAKESGSHAVRIPGALQPTWLDFPQAGIYIGYCTDSSVEGDAGKSFTHKIALPTYGLPLDSVILTTDSDKNIQVVDTETGTKKTLATETSKLPNPYPLTFTGAVNETYDGSSAKTIEIPSGGGLGDFELIGTVDFSQESMAAASAGATFEVTDVSEILLISNDLVNSTSSNSNVLVYLNISSGQVESMLRPDSGKSGTLSSGWVFIKHLSGVGLTGIQSSSAISSTNYNLGTAKIPYNIRPLASDFKITTISVQNPPTQYYAVGGTVKVYVR